MQTHFTYAALMAGILLAAAIGCVVQQDAFATSDSPQTSPESATPTRRKPDAAALRKTLQAKDMASFVVELHEYDWEAANESLAAQAISCLDFAHNATLGVMKSNAATIASAAPPPSKNLYQITDKSFEEQQEQERKLQEEQKRWDEMMVPLRTQLTRGLLSSVALESRCTEIVKAMGPAVAPVLADRRALGRIKELGDKAIPVLRQAAEDRNSRYRLAAYSAIREVFPDAKVQQPSTEELLEVVQRSGARDRLLACKELGRRKPNADMIVAALLKSQGDDVYRLTVADALLNLDVRNFGLATEYLNRPAEREQNGQKAIGFGQSTQSRIARLTDQIRKKPSSGDLVDRAECYAILVRQNQDPATNCARAAEDSTAALKLLDREMVDEMYHLRYADVYTHLGNAYGYLAISHKNIGENGRADQAFRRAAEQYRKALDHALFKFTDGRNEKGGRVRAMAVYHWRGKVLTEYDRLEDAVADYNALLVLFPKDYDKIEAKGDLLLRLNRFSDAAASFVQAYNARQASYRSSGAGAYRDNWALNSVDLARLQWKEAVALDNCGELEKARRARREFDAALQSAWQESR